LFSKITGTEPFYPLNLRHYVFNDWDVSSEKAKNELGFIPTPIEDGLRQTIDWVVQSENLKGKVDV
jgi:nucleoside-diphosphate-sugar epimerase